MKVYEEPKVEVFAFTVENVMTGASGDTPLGPNQSPWG